MPRPRHSPRVARAIYLFYFVDQPVKIPILMSMKVNSIKIPARFIEFCKEWHDGESSMFYALASTGNLTIGNRRPAKCQNDEEWYLEIWRSLAWEASVLYTCSKNKKQDTALMKEFAEYCEERMAEIESAFELENFDS